MNEDRLFAESLLAGTHSIAALKAEFGLLPSEDKPVALPSAPAELDRLLGSKVLPTAVIQSFLTGDDILTDDIVNQMETALETHYGLQEPCYVTSFRSHTEGKLSVDYFYFEKEPAK